MDLPTSPEAKVFAPLIDRADAAGWRSDAARLREVVAIGEHLRSFWPDFVKIVADLITSRERVLALFNVADDALIETLLASVRRHSPGMAEHTRDKATLLAYLQGSRDLYADAVALAMKLGGCASA